MPSISFRKPPTREPIFLQDARTILIMVTENMKQAFGTGRGCYEMFAKEDNP
jgi:hypothetical protein